VTEAQEQWQRCKPWIEAALKHSPGFETIEDVERLVAAGSYQFWQSDECAAITELCNYAQRKVLNVVHGGGDLTSLLDVLEPQMAAYAQANGCDGIMGTGRKGWERPSEKRGYRFACIVMIKDLQQ